MAKKTETPRAATQGELKGEIASIDRDFTQVLFYGGALKILMDGDETLRTRGGAKGLKIYSELKRDGHAAAVLAKRKRAVTAREWEVVPASDDPADAEVAEVITNTLKNLRFDKLCKALLEAVLTGRAITEIMWGVDGRYVIPVGFKKRAPQRFVFDIEGRLRLLTQQQPVDGEALPDRKFIVHLHEADDENPYGQGVGRSIFWPVFFKRQNISFWLIFNDKFGSPTALGKYPVGTHVDDQKKLLQALQAISREASIIVPSGMEAELLEAARSGAADGYERLCDYCDKQITLATLGETLTTSVGDSGSRALGDVHQEVRIELAKDDADDLSDTLNDTLVRWITEFNFPGRMPPKVWRKFDEPEDLDKAAERDSKLAQMGIVPTEERVLEIYGPGYQVKPAASTTYNVDARGTAAPDVDKIMRALAGAKAPAAADFSEPRGVRAWFAKVLRGLIRQGSEVRFAEGEKDAPTVQAERLESVTNKAVSAWIEQIKDIVEKADSLEDLQAKLRALDLKDEELVKVMGEALAAAAVAGRFDIMEQAGAIR